jgi:DNA modification methylase
VGIDASSEAVKGLKHLSRIVGRDFASKSITIHYGAFEDWKPDGVFDLVFTSPPYFCKELYSQDLMQSSARYGDYDSWRDRFLRPLVEKSFTALRENGIFVLNVANVKIGQGYFPVADDADRILREHGVFVMCHNLATRNVYTGEVKTEPMFVFRKNPK